jgi:hypothetical protein
VAIIKASKPIIILLTVAAFALIASTFAAITTNQSLNSIGTITTSPNIGVYSDSACTTPITSLNWGSIAAGGTSTQTVYLKNIGTGSMTIGMTTSGWSPTTATTYLAITWNKEGIVLSAGQSAAATLTLTVSTSTTGITSFSNTITFSGTG